MIPSANALIFYFIRKIVMTEMIILIAIQSRVKTYFLYFTSLLKFACSLYELSSDVKPFVLILNYCILPSLNHQFYRMNKSQKDYCKRVDKTYNAIKNLRLQESSLN